MKILLSLSKESQGEWFRACFSALDAQLCAGYLPPYDPDADALILGGGGDLVPTAGEDPALFFGVDEERQRHEEALTAAFVAEKKSVLGICRGHQLLACLYGGRLMSRLPREELHRREGAWCYHWVEQRGDCPLLRGLPRRFSVWSNHHHGVCTDRGDLQEAAFSDDGLCEAFFHRELPLWGVQWHPERMDDARRFFANFLQLVQEEKLRKNKAEPI